MERRDVAAGEVERGATRAGRVDRPAVDLDLADTHRPVTGDDPEGVAVIARAAPERAGHHRAATLDREDAIDGERRGGTTRAGPRPDAIADLPEGVAHRVEAVARHRGDR